MDGKDVLVLYVPMGETGEFHVSGPTVRSVAIGSPLDMTPAPSDFKVNRVAGNFTISFTPRKSGITVARFVDGTRIVLIDRETAYRFWAPTLSNNPLAPVNETGESGIPRPLN